MDSPPSKRRKTSPETSIRVNDQDRQLRPDSKDDKQFPSRRALFMSPTKASLARFHPGLLSPTKSTTPRRRGSSDNQGASRRGMSAERVNNGNAVMRAKSTEPSAAATETTLAPALETNGQVFFSTPRQRSRTPEQETTKSKKAKLSMVEDIRASPPEEAIEEDNMVQDTQDTRQRDVRPNEADTQLHQLDIADENPAVDQPRLPSTQPHLDLQGSLLSMGQQEDAEPSLPSTPVQLGLEKPPEPPKGLFFSSPSRRPKRIGIARAKSSPLKLQTVDPVQHPLSPKSSRLSLGPRVYIANTPKPLPTSQAAQISSIGERLAVLEEQLQEIGIGLIRGLLLSGWEDNNSKGTVQGLKREKEILAKSTKVIHLREELCQLEVANAKAVDVTGAEFLNQDAINRLSNGNAAIDHSSASPKLPPLSHRLARFLPFSCKPPPPTPKPPSPQDQDPTHTLNLGPPEDGRVPFIITTSDSILLPSTPDNTLLQSQNVTLSSGSQALFVRLKLTVDVVSQTVTHMQVVELSDWAEGELGIWLRASSQERSIAAVGTAFGQYWLVGLQRLKCWGDAVRNHGDMIADDRGFGRLSSRPTNADLAYVTPHLCWRDLHLARGTLSLTIQWRVSISDDGKVDSDVSALAKFPDTWRWTEDGAELDKVGEAFKMLLNDRGAAEAICVLAGLLLPS